MIELKHLGKIYSSASGSVEALKDVNLTIADGEIFGIIGLSGAGKSTLVRCINLLERPTSGEVLVDGQNIMALSQKERMEQCKTEVPEQREIEPGHFVVCHLYDQK